MIPSPSHHAHAERVRVAQHIARAELALRAPVALDPVQRITRALVRVALARYRQRGNFPQNTGHRLRTPYFVDAFGAPCAVAYLMQASGESALVEAVQRERNHASVRELADEPRFTAWLAAAGLSVAEAQAIQPTYRLNRDACLCGGSVGISSTHPLSGPGPADGVLVGTVTALGVDDTVSVQVEELYGRVDGPRVGDTVQAPLMQNLSSTYTRAPAVGARVLVPVHLGGVDAGASENGLWAPIALDADGEFSCTSDDYTIGPLDQEQLSGVLVAPDCTEALTQINPRWTKVEGGGDSGCSLANPTTGQGFSTSLGVLLALASALAVRRAQHTR